MLTIYNIDVTSLASKGKQKQKKTGLLEMKVEDETNLVCVCGEGHLSRTQVLDFLFHVVSDALVVLGEELFGGSFHDYGGCGCLFGPLRNRDL